MGISPDPHRRRMPWTAEKECVPGVVHSSKEKMVLDGAQRVGVECVDRVHRRCIRWRHCGRPSPHASTIHAEERTFLIVLSGGIQCNWAMLYREEWPEGTHDENATRTVIHFRRHGSNPARANTPCGFSEVARAVLFVATVPPPRASVQKSLSMQVPVACGHTPID
ncbi:hypothetical protein TcCL_ESM07227 [Trypanosoma cruzi]|nr:hypothetical protein TcCL_ESM07227 [Trypanosoma cruzi]